MSLGPAVDVCRTLPRLSLRLLPGLQPLGLAVALGVCWNALYVVHHLATEPHLQVSGSGLPAFVPACPHHSTSCTHHPHDPRDHLSTLLGSVHQGVKCLNRWVPAPGPLLAAADPGNTGGARLGASVELPPTAGLKAASSRYRRGPPACSRA